jgi:hypothetical protein
MTKFVTILILFLLFKMPLFAQDKGDSTETITEFKNQGEQENYWATQLFKKEYKEHYFLVFKDRILISGDAFVFTGDSLFVNNSSAEMKAVFSNGLLYPALIGGNRITDIEELKFVEKSEKRRRFRFLLYQKWLSNPTVCFFELTNMNATQATDLSEFIRGATLTFFKRGWIMI